MNPHERAPSPRGPVPVTVVVLTRDEERNLAPCLESVAGWAAEMWVVDSGSTDGTVAVAERHGARVVHHPFTTHAAQWNWAVDHLPIRTAWTLALDADQRVTPELAAAIAEATASPSKEVDGFYVRRRQVFRGRWIRHGGYYPKYMLKLFRTGRARCDEGELLDFRFYVGGATARLPGDLVEHNLKEDDIRFWLAKHIEFAARQAREEHRRRTAGSEWRVTPSLRGTPDQRVLWQKRLWYRMPLYVRPFLYFAYRYFLRLGFLDGRQGLVFHFLQSCWYRFVVDVMLDELQREGGDR